MERTAPGACAGRRLRFAKRRAFADGDAGAIGVDDGADHHYIEYLVAGLAWFFIHRQVRNRRWRKAKKHPFYLFR